MLAMYKAFIERVVDSVSDLFRLLPEFRRAIGFRMKKILEILPIIRLFLWEDNLDSA